MLLRINDIAPDFTASTTQGEISLHDWIGGRKIMFDFSCWNNDKNNRSLKFFHNQINRLL